MDAEQGNCVNHCSSPTAVSRFRTFLPLKWPTDDSVMHMCMSRDRFIQLERFSACIALQYSVIINTGAKKAKSPGEEKISGELRALLTTTAG